MYIKFLTQCLAHSKWSIHDCTDISRNLCSPSAILQPLLGGDGNSFLAVVRADQPLGEGFMCTKLFFKNYFIYLLFLAVLGLRCCAGFL